MLRSARIDAYLVAAAASWGLGTVLTKYALGGFDPTLLLPLLTKLQPAFRENLARSSCPMRTPAGTGARSAP